MTQFEALTATGYLALEQAGVELAVIEAGLGGRYDATNVIPSEVQVLTTVGLEHTRWLGDTIEQISASLFAPSQPVDSCAADIGGDLQLIDEIITGLVAAGLLRRLE